MTKDLLGGVDPANAYALKVKGDSMIDSMIREGDIVILRKQETANNGDMVAVWLTDRSETTLKYFHNEGSRIRLQPAHPHMKPIYVDPSICRVEGKVLSVIRHMGLLDRIPAGLDTEGIMARLKRDKKKAGESIHFVLLKRPGMPFVNGGVPLELVRETIEAMKT